MKVSRTAIIDIPVDAEYVVNYFRKNFLPADQNLVDITKKDSWIISANSEVLAEIFRKDPTKTAYLAAMLSRSKAECSETVVERKSFIGRKVYSHDFASAQSFVRHIEKNEFTISSLDGSDYREISSRFSSLSTFAMPAITVLVAGAVSWAGFLLQKNSGKLVDNEKRFAPYEEASREATDPHYVLEKVKLQRAADKKKMSPVTVRDEPSALLENPSEEKIVEPQQKSKTPARP